MGYGFSTIEETKVGHFTDPSSARESFRRWTSTGSVPTTGVFELPQNHKPQSLDGALPIGPRRTGRRYSNTCCFCRETGEGREERSQRLCQAAPQADPKAQRATRQNSFDSGVLQALQIKLKRLTGCRFCDTAMLWRGSVNQIDLPPYPNLPTRSF